MFALRINPDKQKWEDVTPIFSEDAKALESVSLALFGIAPSIITVEQSGYHEVYAISPNGEEIHKVYANGLACINDVERLIQQKFTSISYGPVGHTLKEV